MNAKIDKKCPHCSKWTAWDGKPNSTCEHCLSPLDARAVEERKEWIAREESYKMADFFVPKPNDGPFILLIRKVGFVLHLIFGGIAWLFIWAFASTPG